MDIQKLMNQDKQFELDFSLLNVKKTKNETVCWCVVGTADHCLLEAAAMVMTSDLPVLCSTQDR